jgi:putative transposase
MGRAPRVDIAGLMYHVINRSNGRVELFNTDGDYQSIENSIVEAHDEYAVNIYAYCIMPNHWHLVVSPREDGEMSRFMQWLSLTHTQRYHAFHKTIGHGHIYQGRYKSFPVQTNEYFSQLVRYVERNPVRAHLVRKAEQWKWSSLHRREYGTKEQQKLLTTWPTGIPDDYLSYVNTKEKDIDLEEMRDSITKGRPYGSLLWTKRIVDTYDLGLTTRSIGRPKKGT